ncbi:MAG: DUF2878 domain-containing protein [Gammaproteobacteria bacterium]|nr:DUF2878 domain-containing protein [Gammaproteobacteria bacterium]
MFLLLNVLAFKAAWAASVVGGAQQMPWLGPLAVLVAIMLHLFRAERPLQEMLLVISAGLIGTIFDSQLLTAGWVSYTAGLYSDFVAPYWITTMWMLFATTLNVSMRWLRGREAVAALLGLIGGPLAYIAGQKIGAIVLIEQTTALIALGVGWAVMMPLLVRLSIYLDGMEDVDKTAAAYAGGPA